MPDPLETIQALRDQLEGTDSEEARRLDEVEKVVKRAMLTKSLGEHPAMLMLRETLNRRLELCDKVIIGNAREIPTDQAGILSYALRQKEVDARKSCYEWFLRLFTVAEQRAEVVNRDLGRTGRRK